MTVASVDTTDAFDLRREAGLLKAALLYADDVQLASPKLGLLARLSADAAVNSTLPTLEQLQRDPPAEAEAWTGRHPRGRPLSWEERGLIKGFENRLMILRAQQASAVAKGSSADAPGVAEIERALAAGVVVLDSVGSDYGASGFLRECVVARLEDLMVAALEPGSTIYPLFDHSAWEMTRKLVLQGRVRDPQYGFARQAGFAEHLLAALEAFPRAPMDAILDVRERLTVPLVRFRAAVAEAALQLEATPADAAFNAEALDIHRRLVAPALAELTESLERLGALPTLRRGWPKLAAGAVGFAAGAAVGVPDLAALAAATAGTVGSIVTYEELKYRNDESRARRSNKWFFVHEVQRWLGA